MFLYVTRILFLERPLRHRYLTLVTYVTIKDKDWKNQEIRIGNQVRSEGNVLPLLRVVQRETMLKLDGWGFRLYDSWNRFSRGFGSDVSWTFQFIGEEWGLDEVNWNVHETSETSGIPTQLRPENQFQVLKVFFTASYDNFLWFLLYVEL